MVVPQFAAVFHWFSVDFQNHVASLDAAFLGRTGGADIAHEDALHIFQVHRLGNARRNVLHHDAEVRAIDFAVIENLAHHAARHVDGNGKSDSFIAARSVRKDGGVDSDQFAAIVHQRAAGIAGVNRRIGLDKIFVIFDTQISAVHGADDSHGDGLADAKRIADGQSIVAHLHLGGITDRDGGESASVHLQHGNVRLGIGSHDLGLQLAFVGERDANVGGAVDDVVVRQNVAVRAHDDAGAEAVFALVARSHRAIIRIGTGLLIGAELLSKELLEKWRHSVRHHRTDFDWRL